MSSEKQQFIQELCLTEYGIKADGTQDKSLIPMARKLKNAVDLLSKELYAKDIHFILELIQNAQDNSYQERQPDIEFLLLDYDPTGTENSDGCLCLFNNEIGFTEKNIDAICGIGMSTKNKIEGYIGEKGIGFKSVFIVSSAPHIYSNGFQIKFMENDPNLELSYIVPYWLSTKPEVVQSRNANTAILLPLKKDKRQKIHTELQKIRPETILFLSKLQNMTIYFKEGTNEETLKLARMDNGYPIVQLSINGKIYSYWLRKDAFTVPENLVEEKRENVKEREITIAFPLDAEKDQIEHGRIFAFLPTEVVSGLPFLVNADFILSSSREAIQTDRSWNLWLRDCIAEVVVKGLLELIQCPQYQITAYAFIPLISELKENPDFFGPICEAVCLNLSHKKVVLTESGNLDLPKNTRLTIKEIRHLFRDITDRPVIFKELQFVADEISSKEQLKAIGVNDFTWPEFYDALCDQIWIESRTTDWLLELYNFLFKREKEIDLDDLRRLPILVIEGGQIIKSSKRIYFFSNEGISALKKQYIDGSFSGYLLKQELSDKIVNDLVLMSWFETKLQVRKFSLSTYLTRSLLPQFKNHLSHLCDQDILEVTRLMLDNWQLLDPECKENLKKNAVLLLDNSCIELSSNLKDRELIVPAGYDQDHGWHLFLKEKEECDHLYILSDQYLQFKNSHTESLTEFLAIIGAKNIPFLKTMKFTKGTNYPSQYEEYLQLYLDKFNKNSTKDITLSTWMPPSIFYVSRSKKTDKNYIAFIFWLEEMIKPIVKRKHFTIESDIKEGKIDSFYRTYISDKVISGLLHYLKSIPWVKSTKGFKKPGEIFKENKQIRNMFRSYLPYLRDEISDDLCKLLGVKTEITSETIIQYLQELSQGKDVKKNVVEKLYEYLAQYGKKSDFDQFKQSALIYIPEPQAKWYKPDEVMWKDSSAIFGDVYGWIEPVYGDLKKLFTEKLGIKISPDIEEYAKAWLRLQNRDDLADQDVEKLLDEIYAKLVSSLPKLVSSLPIKDEPNWWKEFKNSAKVWVKNSGFQDRNSVLVADDEELRRLFKDINYAWKPERFSYEEIMQLFDELSLQYLSANVEIGLDESNNSENKITDEPTILTNLSKLLFCYLLYEDKGLYEKQFDEEKLLEDKPL
ncbi:MAG TPA: hypothetical protein DCS17_10715, partial [Flavobacterium sp.]|nr:hypothetical protein [Flavobacterium sp.]